MRLVDIPPTKSRPRFAISPDDLRPRARHVITEQAAGLVVR